MRVSLDKTSKDYHSSAYSMICLLDGKDVSMSMWMADEELGEVWRVYPNEKLEDYHVFKGKVELQCRYCRQHPSPGVGCNMGNHHKLPPLVAGTVVKDDSGNEYELLKKLSKD